MLEGMSRKTSSLKVCVFQTKLFKLVSHQIKSEVGVLLGKLRDKWLFILFLFEPVSLNGLYERPIVQMAYPEIWPEFSKLLVA